MLLVVLILVAYIFIATVLFNINENDDCFTPTGYFHEPGIWCALWCVTLPVWLIIKASHGIIRLVVKLYLEAKKYFMEGDKDD